VRRTHEIPGAGFGRRAPANIHIILLGVRPGANLFPFCTLQAYESQSVADQGRCRQLSLGRLETADLLQRGEDALSVAMFVRFEALTVRGQLQLAGMRMLKPPDHGLYPIFPYLAVDEAGAVKPQDDTRALGSGPPVSCAIT